MMAQNAVPILQDPLFADIQGFITSNISFSSSVQYLMLDNNELSDMALLANNDPTALKDLLSTFVDVVLLIPDVVFEESIYNIQNQTHFNKVYFNFYQHASAVLPIFVLTTEQSFKWFAGGFEKEQDAFLTYVEIAKRSMENLEIRSELAKSQNINDVEMALRHIPKDAGERFAFLFCHALIADGARNLLLLSNEIKGVYHKAKRFSRDETLLSLIFLQNNKAYEQNLRVITFNKLVYDYVSSTYPTDLQKRGDFLKIVRNGNVGSREVSFAQISTQSLSKQGVSDEEFSQIVGDSDYILFY